MRTVGKMELPGGGDYETGYFLTAQDEADCNEWAWRYPTQRENWISVQCNNARIEGTETAKARVKAIQLHIFAIHAAHKGKTPKVAR